MKTTTSTLRLIIVLFLMASLNSCSNKDDDNPPPAPTVAELLAHKWFFLKRENSGGTVIKQADACTGQTFLDFKSDGTFTFQEFDYDSAHICDHSPVEDGGYTLSADETKLMVTGPFGDDTLPIKYISETELALVFAPDEINIFKH